MGSVHLFFWFYKGETNPSYVERHLLPYTMAVVTELNRIASVSVMSLFYECEKDLTIVGQRIPAGVSLQPLTVRNPC